MDTGQLEKTFYPVGGESATYEVIFQWLSSSRQAETSGLASKQSSKEI